MRVNRPQLTLRNDYTSCGTRPKLAKQKTWISIGGRKIHQDELEGWFRNNELFINLILKIFMSVRPEWLRSNCIEGYYRTVLLKEIVKIIKSVRQDPSIHCLTAALRANGKIS
jgi:hypothetical protein